MLKERCQRVSLYKLIEILYLTNFLSIKLDEIYQNPISNVTMPVTSPDEAGLDENAWATHEDQIAVGSKKENEEESADDSCSDVEEFVPSCWDSMATPARSALKSPDKSSSVSFIVFVSKHYIKNLFFSFWSTG